MGPFPTFYRPPPTPGDYLKDLGCGCVVLISVLIMIILLLLGAYAAIDFLWQML